jgi:peptide/nickel transport system substrate-binding protein
MGMQITLWSGGLFARDADRYLITLLRNLGYRASVKMISGSSYFGAVKDSQNRAQIGEEGWLADYPAPSNFINSTLSCNSFRPRSPTNNNVSEFCSPAIDAQIAKALGDELTDPEGANQLWARIDRELADQAPWIPLMTPQNADFASTRVGNYQFHPEFGALLDQLWVR